MDHSAVRAPSCVGRVPLRLLLLNRIPYVSAVTAPSCVGTVPLRLLSSNPMPVSPVTEQKWRGG